MPPGINPRRRLHTDVLSMPAEDTEYSFFIPEGATYFVAKLADSNVEWRWSAKVGVVAAVGGGMPMDGNEALDPEDSEFAKQQLFFAHTGGSAQELKYSYMYPVGPR